MITYSTSGIEKQSGPLGHTWTARYTNAGYSVSAYSISQDAINDGAGSPGSAQCSGDIIVHFNWSPDTEADLPPQAVAIKLQAKTSWSGDSGSCGDGLGDTPIVSADGFSGSCGGYSCFIKKTPGQSFDLTYSPSASATIAQYPLSDCAAADCSVYFKAECVNFGLHFGGVIPGTNESILGRYVWSSVTQEPNGYMVGGEESQNQVSLALSNYLWNVPGPIFGSFFVSEDQTHGNKVDVDPAEFTSERPYVIYMDGNIDPMWTAHFDAQWPGCAPLRASASDSIHIDVPKWDMTATTGKFEPYVLSSDGLVRGISAGDPLGPNYGVVITVSATSAEEHAGRIQSVQLVNGTMGLNGGTKVNTNGSLVLDTKYPMIPSLDEVWPANGIPHEVKDSPHVFSQVGPVAYGEMDLEYKNYLMFQSQRGGDWASVGRLNWSANGRLFQDIETGVYTLTGTINWSPKEVERTHPFWTDVALSDEGESAHGSGAPQASSQRNNQTQAQKMTQHNHEEDQIVARSFIPQRPKPVGEREDPDPQGRGPRLYKADKAMELGDFASAREDLEILCSQDPENGIYVHYLARCYAALGDYRSVYDRLQPLMTQRPGLMRSIWSDACTLCLYGEAAYQLGHREEAHQLFQKCLQHSHLRVDVDRPIVPTNGQSPETVRAAAHLACGRESAYTSGGGNKAYALREIELSLEIDPSSEGARYYHALLLRRIAPKRRHEVEQVMRELANSANPDIRAAAKAHLQ